MENNQDMQQPQAVIEETGIKLPKNCKENRYYYRHREEILEKRRLTRLAKKGIDVTVLDAGCVKTVEDKRKKKMEFLGLVEQK
jgi:hypothetical protein